MILHVNPKSSAVNYVYCSIVQPSGWGEKLYVNTIQYVSALVNEGECTCQVGDLESIKKTKGWGMDRCRGKQFDNLVNNVGHQARAAYLGRLRTPPQTVGRSGSLAMVDTDQGNRFRVTGEKGGKLWKADIRNAERKHWKGRRPYGSIQFSILF